METTKTYVATFYNTRGFVTLLAGVLVGYLVYAYYFMKPAKDGKVPEIPKEKLWGVYAWSVGAGLATVVLLHHFVMPKVWKLEMTSNSENEMM